MNVLNSIALGIGWLILGPLIFTGVMALVLAPFFGIAEVIRSVREPKPEPSAAP